VKAWTLDFETRVLTEIPAAGIGEARESGRFCWLDVAESEPYLAGLAAEQPDLPDEFAEDVVRDLMFSDGWLAFGLVEPRVATGCHRSIGLNVLFSSNLLVTVDFGGSDTLERLRQTWRDDFMRHARSPGFFLFEIADHFTSIAQRQVHDRESRVTALQARLFGDVDDGVFAETARFVQQLGDFRHRLIIAHEIFDELATRTSTFVPETTQPFLARNADRVERTANELQLQRDALLSALNLCIGMTGHRTGQLLKRLTGFSMIFLPLSFLAGVFGMNFQHLPGLSAEWGFVGFCAASAAITLVLLGVARRARWF
jgi:Mg2+ and Co2+ transporter CorA